MISTVFYSLINRYSDWITDYEVSDFRKYGDARSLVAKVKFVDNSALYIKDYLFADGSRKYSFHWQTVDGELLARWDNSPHHNHISTFPHHRHDQYNVLPSQAFTLAAVLECIVEDFQNRSS